MGWEKYVASLLEGDSGKTDYEMKGPKISIANKQKNYVLRIGSRVAPLIEPAR